MPDVKELLSSSALFEGGSPAIIASFLECAKKTHFSEGELPVVETGMSNSILMVTDGEVLIEVALQCSDQELKVLRAGPGTFLGLVSFFGAAIQPYTATALTKIEVLAWQAEDWHRLCAENPQFGWRLSQRIGAELVNRMSNLIQHLLNTVCWGM